MFCAHVPIIDIYNVEKRPHYNAEAKRQNSLLDGCGEAELQHQPED